VATTAITGANQAFIDAMTSGFWFSVAFIDAMTSGFWFSVAFIDAMTSGFWFSVAFLVTGIAVSLTLLPKKSREDQAQRASDGVADDTHLSEDDFEIIPGTVIDPKDRRTDEEPKDEDRELISID
jgi:hypothetical protein